MKPKILKSFMGLHECEILCSYINLRTKTGRVAKRMLKSGKVWEVHGTALTDSIGLTYLHNAEEHFKQRLSLTSSMLKRWDKGVAMNWHINKWEFEYVVCIQVSDDTWPIGFAKGQDNPLVEGLQYDAQVLEPMQGDAVLFNGATTYHGRRRLEASSCTTLCLYYVEKDGYLDNKAGRVKNGDDYKTRIELYGELQYDA